MANERTHPVFDRFRRLYPDVPATWVSEKQIEADRLEEDPDTWKSFLESRGIDYLTRDVIVQYPEDYAIRLIYNEPRSSWGCGQEAIDTGGKGCPEHGFECGVRFT